MLVSWHNDCYFLIRQFYFNYLRRLIVLTKKSAAFALLLAFTISSFACAEEIRHHEFPVDDLDSLRMSVNVGSINVRAGQDDIISVHLKLEDDGEDAWINFGSSNLDSNTDLESSVRGNALYLRFDEEDIKSTWEIEVPPNFSTEIDMAVGAVEISGLYGDQEIDLAVGSVSIRQAEESIAEVELKSNVGDTQVSGIKADNERKALIGSSSFARGEGDSYINVTVNVGEASFRAQ